MTFVVSVNAANPPPKFKKRTDVKSSSSSISISLPNDFIVKCVGVGFQTGGPTIQKGYPYQIIEAQMSSTSFKERMVCLGRKRKRETSPQTELHQENRSRTQMSIFQNQPIQAQEEFKPEVMIIEDQIKSDELMEMSVDY